MLLLGLIVLVATSGGQPLTESCFQDGVTWDHGEDNVAEFQINTPSASACQEKCFQHPRCTNFTWYSADSLVFSRICVIYAHVPVETYECWDCVSGPNICQETTTSQPPSTTTPLTSTTTKTTTTTTTTPTTTTTTTTPLTTTTTPPITTTKTTTHPTITTTTTLNQDCNSDCRCADFTYDVCSRPHPTASLHVQDEKECYENCRVFALENRCQFIIFLETDVDENCLIMNDDIHLYLRACGTKGQPLYQAGNDLMQDCSSCTDCDSSCISCYEFPCFGYAQLECELTTDSNKGAEKDSYMECLSFCKEDSGSTYAIYDGMTCHCYSSGERDCGRVAIQLEADECIDENHLL